jgi:hypothetical protein
LVSVAGCLVPLASPAGNAGRLTTVDGQPVADASVVVETLSIWSDPRRRLRGEPYNRVKTRTDSDGRWLVRGATVLRFGVPAADGLPAWLDEYTFSAPDGRTLGCRTPDIYPRRHEPETPLRVEWDPWPPWSVTVLPVFGVTAGAAQTVAAHAGGMVMAGRRAVGVGLRAAAEVGATGAGASAALVVASGALQPMLALEIGARYLRPWAHIGTGAWLAPEVALDFFNLRFSVGASTEPRRASFGIGWGFF